ncbi:MAG: maleylpyruvate isomerase [Pseudonocardiales bacterium]|jgi:maleylpyruvate isomerase|nr:maleylpyruvate isomerase [Pseudonocardiales bacterium]MDT4941902.1 maleylpyruvate isomerase [Pseudonocardiales bacterium]
MTAQDWNDQFMSEPTAHLLALRASTADLIQGLSSLHWSEADVAAPSLCDGWTRGHVLTHIARNAEGIADTIAGALRDEIVERYPDGWDARNAAIDAGAGRPYAALVADVRETADRLDRVLGAVGEADAWGKTTAEDGTPEGWVYRRWREVEVHRVDLAADYTPDRWPPLFVTTVLAESVESLGSRVDGAVHVTVTAEGSLSPEYVGKQWRVGEGHPIEVCGPDWAVLAWLMGRPAAAGDALSATPPLGAWR